MVSTVLARVGIGVGVVAMVAAFVLNSPSTLCIGGQSWRALMKLTPDGQMMAPTSFSAEQPIAPFVGARCRIGINDHIAEDLIVDWPLTGLLTLGAVLTFMAWVALRNITGRV